MSASRLAVLAAIASVVAWRLKAVAIAIAGGLDKSPLESPLFVLGLVAIVVAHLARPDHDALPWNIGQARQQRQTSARPATCPGLLAAIACAW